MNRGMTLLEMVIALSMMAVVFAAVVPTFAAIRNSWAAYQGEGEILQNARVLAEHMYRHLFEAAAITDVSSPSNTVGYIELRGADDQEYRYELGADGYVRFGALDDLAVLAGPVSELGFTCYDGNDFSASTTEAGTVRFVTIRTTFPPSTPLASSRSYATSVFLRTERLDESDGVTVDPGISVQRAVDWGGWGTTIDSYRSLEGPYDAASPGDEAVMCVNATGNNTIDLWTGTTLRGDAYVGPDGDPDSDIDVSGSAVVTGDLGVLSELVSIPALSAPTGSPFEDENEGDLIVKSETVSLTSNRHYENLRIEDGGKVIIQGDLTILLDGQCEVTGDGELEILADSTLRLYCTNKVDLEGTAQVNTADADPTRLRLYMLSNEPFRMVYQAELHGVVQNPGGSATISDDAQLFGKLRAYSLQGGGRIHVDLDSDFDLGED